VHVVLYRPEIAGNTGSLMRLSANTGTTLHLVHPLGFELDEPRLRRAGLDYREWADVVEHHDLDEALAVGARVLALTRRGSVRYDAVDYRSDDVLLFGPESTGLPDEVVTRADLALRIPMQSGSRSLNLANAASVVVYEALRQRGFEGLD
jgi:tRNA (cytidine/uridine-2'-O-)-methyltransferase